MKDLKLATCILLLTFSCSPKKSSVSSEKINGTYVRETSFEVSNVNTGKIIGTGTIRDSIFIVGTENNFKISNRKWRLNNYDNEGWQNMRHSGDRPTPTYDATFNKTDSSLVPVSLLTNGRLYLNFKNGILKREANDGVFYTKVK